MVDGDGQVDVEATAAAAESLASAKTRKETALADLRELELRRRRGELLERRVVENRVFELARRERDAWLTWPARVGAVLAAELGVASGDSLPIGPLSLMSSR